MSKTHGILLMQWWTEAMVKSEGGRRAPVVAVGRHDTADPWIAGGRRRPREIR
jgi:hypothetical protein